MEGGERGAGRGAGGQLRSCINHVSSGLTLPRLSLPSGAALAPPAFGTVSHFERLIDGAQHQGHFARLLFLQLCLVASMTELPLQFFFLLSLCISVLFIPQFLISSLPLTPHIPLMRDTHADRPPRKKMTLDDTILALSSRTIGCLQIRVDGHYSHFNLLVYLSIWLFGREGNSVITAVSQQYFWSPAVQ